MSAGADGNGTEPVGSTTPPLSTLHFYLTQGCNLACRHCWLAPKFNPSGSRYPVLPVELFEIAIGEAKPLGLTGVKLTTCVAQSYYRTQSLWSPFWFCEQAGASGQFPPSRVGCRPAPQSHDVESGSFERRSHMSEKSTLKKKYQSPTVLDLGELARGSGQCEAGGSDATYCRAGGVAGGDCTAGTTAVTYCTEGTVAGTACTDGLDATTACTAGPQF